MTSASGSCDVIRPVTSTAPMSWLASDVPPIETRPSNDGSTLLRFESLAYARTSNFVDFDIMDDGAGSAGRARVACVRASPKIAPSPSRSSMRFGFPEVGRNAGYGSSALSVIMLFHCASVIRVR